jgi:hypothetical protein
MDTMLTFQEFKQKNVTTVLPLREKYVRGLVFSVGQIVEDASGKYEILDRGTNYVTVCDSMGQLHKKFIDSVHLSEDTTIAYKTDYGSFKGYVPKNLSEAATEAFDTTIARYEDGNVQDAVAILKSLKAVDSLFEAVSQNQIDVLQSSLTRIGEWESHQTYIPELTKQLDENLSYKSSDRLKIATAIANTLGASDVGSNPEFVVNNALRFARTEGILENLDTKKVLDQMLVLAESVGISYDKKIMGCTESHVIGSPVKIKHDNGREMYGIVDGIHGPVVSVKHGNNRVTFNHNYKLEKYAGKIPKDAKTFDDIKDAAKNIANLGNPVTENIDHVGLLKQAQLAHLHAIRSGNGKLAQKHAKRIAFHTRYVK